ncbi:MAG: redoxin domain-containing protein [Bacteroidota bacterium]
MLRISFFLCLYLVFAGMCGFTSAQNKKLSGGKGDLESGLPPDIHRLKIGDAAPDFELLGIDGKTYTLAEFKTTPVLMVVFLSNHCPYSHAAETRLLPLAAEFKRKGLEVVAINPNSPEGVSIDELGYSKYNDGYEEMKLYAKEAGFTFPYLYDGEKQVTAKAYGCLATPHVFLFDQQRRLRYAGRFDDSRFADASTVTSPDTRNAVQALLTGRPVPVETTKPMGCSTKWNSKKEEIALATEKWEKAPVTLETIGVAGVADLAANKSSKYRLFNVWATWCAPCVKEFPGLVSISRRLGNRDFELITISLDDPKEQSKVQSFLEQQHVAIPNRVGRSLKAEGRKTNNYLFTGANTDSLIQALDPSWPGPLPHSVLVAPGGRIIYSHNGLVDSNDLLARILKELGPYYK